MSEVSVLSQEYKTASDLSRALNAALIILKKRRLNLAGPDTITSDDLERSRRCLSEVLEDLRDLLQPAQAIRSHAKHAAVARVSGALVMRLRTEQQGALNYYLQDLESINTRLLTGVEALTESDLDRLDELAAAADAETSSVFRRLMRT